jgi:hypothetical protein
MSAPESNSKVPPSLLSEPAKGEHAGGSRILANLEGRVDSSANSKPKRSRAVPVIVIALLVLACGAGVYQWHAGRADEKTVAADAAKSDGKVASGATAGVPAASTVTAAATAAVAASSAPATIVADDDASKNAQHAQAAGDDGNRLSRALADGASSTDEPSSSAAAATKHADTKPAHEKHDDRHDKRQLAEQKHGKESRATVASHTKKPSGKAEPKDDSDADLLAALVARTKPASSKGDDKATAAKKVSDTPTTLAARINECGQHGFFEEQLCRWRVCDGHWGKDPHCPSASAQVRQP